MVFLGALNLTREAADNSKRINSNHLKTQEIVTDAERQCRRTEKLFSKPSTPEEGQRIKDFVSEQKKNEKMLNDLNEQIANYEGHIPSLNDMVCLFLLGK